MKNLRRIAAILLSFALVLGLAVPAAAAEEHPDEVYTDLLTAAAAVRQQMVARQPVITFTIASHQEEEQMVDALVEEIFAHTGVPVEGDYLYRHCKRLSIDVENPEDGLRTVTLNFTYRTTAQQEADMDVAVAALLEELDLERAGDYKKISVIYDYICDTVEYDDIGFLVGNNICYTAYGALVGRAAVCQGYASLFYRLALEVGVDARILSGTSRNRSHAWNIVSLDGLYYNVDATWDAPLAQGGSPYAYFLRTDENFADHTRSDQYTTVEFMSSYPMAGADCTGLKGDVDGNRQVDEDDAIYLLQHVLMAEDFPVTQPVDYSGDGRVDETDAIHLLQYVLMPGSFPI